MKAEMVFKIEGINWKFLGLFMLYLGIFVGLVQVPESLYREALRFTASAVASFWKMFSIPVSSVDTYVTFFNFTMEIVLECTGLHYAVIFMAAILAFQGHTFLYKTFGLIVGIGLIFLLNLVRLGIIGIVGHYSANLFSFVHLYLWQALFTLVVLLFWIIWANGKIGFSWVFTTHILLVLATGSISFWFMITYFSYYLSFIAYLADSIFPLLSGLMSIPTSVIAEGELIGYISGRYVIYSETGLYVLNYVIFLSLASVFALSSERKLFLKRFMAGTGLMIAFHLGLIIMDWSLEVTTSVTKDSSVLIWCIVLSSMLAPLVSWLCATLLFPSEAKMTE